MFKFENQLIKLKHEVLTNIVRLAKNNNITKESLQEIPYTMLPGDEPQYRESVAHERAILLERLKLASGFVPNGKGVEELIDIEDEKQILYVIENACDMCPTKKFEVTDACRNCIAHKCQSSCNFGAISYVDGKAYIDPDKCKECGMCKKACPYDAIAEDMRPCKRSCPTGALDINNDKRAMIKQEKCVNCGACMAACPFGALEDRSLLVRVVKELTTNEHLYAVVAPAITGQLGAEFSYGQIKNAIKKLGFRHMVEAACGADAVTVHESNEFVERMENGDSYMTNSCCPGFFSYIEKLMPDQVNKISGTVSPMVATGRYIKEHDKDAKVVFIGPCTAKKSEILRDSIKDAVDYVLTFEELLALFDGFNVNPSGFYNIIVDEASVLGRGFGASGGLTAAIENYIKYKDVECDFKPVKASGGAEIKKTMMMAKAGKLNGNFIEGMMCEGGCINGSGKIISFMKARAPFNKINKESSMQNVLDNSKLEEYKKIDLER